MANIQERAQLHNTIWEIANDLRGSVDGWEFKAQTQDSEKQYEYYRNKLLTFE